MQTMEVAESIASQITESLDLEHRITPLAFVSEEELEEDQNS